MYYRQAVWEPNHQRYYFVEVATGRTQWEMPTMPSSASASSAPVGEASSYAGGGGSQMGYPSQQQGYTPHQNYANQPQQQQQQAGGTDERGLGSMLSSVMGGGGHHGSGKNRSLGYSSTILLLTQHYQP